MTAVKVGMEITPKKEGIDVDDNFMDGNARMMKYLENRDKGNFAPVPMPAEINYRSNNAYGIVSSPHILTFFKGNYV